MANVACMSEQVCATALSSVMLRRTEPIELNEKSSGESKYMDKKSVPDSGLNRRDFLKGAVAGSTALATGLPHVLEAEEATSSFQPFAELRSLPPGVVKPEGWLKAHAQGQARLSSALPDISYPF